MSDIKLEDLSQEQRNQIRKEIMDELKAEQKASDEKAAADGEWVVTNALDSTLMIPDLGIALASGQFEAETFKPFEAKDLADVYEVEELRKSKYLRMLLRKEDGRLVRGRVPREELDVKRDPLTVLCRDNPNGSFTDPLSGGQTEEGEAIFGGRDFDQKLKKLHARDRREDMTTRKH